jgi:hypothetical protein
MKKLVVLFGIGLILACDMGSNREEGLLSEEQMVDLLADYHFAQSYQELKGLPQDTLFLYTNRHFVEILEDKGIEEEAFRATFDWYLRNPKKFHALYDQVVLAIDSTMLE